MTAREMQRARLYKLIGIKSNKDIETENVYQNVLE